MIRSEQLRDNAATAIDALTDKVCECVTLGRPGDVQEYASALSYASSAYRDLTQCVIDEREDQA